MNDSSSPTPEKIVNYMLENDPFSQWLNIQLLEVGEGQCKLKCCITDEMLNGYKMAHGGIIFSLADSAIAFASASFGRRTVAIDHSISFIKKAVRGDILFVKAKTLSMGFKTGVVQVKITSQDDELVAIIKGTIFRTDKKFDLSYFENIL